MGVHGLPQIVMGFAKPFPGSSMDIHGIAAGFHGTGDMARHENVYQ